MATNKQQQLLEAYKQTQADIGNIIGWINCELGKYDESAPTWGTVGSLKHVRQNLIETLTFLSGIDEAAIKRGLEEMNS